MQRIRLFTPAVVLVVAAVAWQVSAVAREATPQQAVEELLAADRGFAKAADGKDVVAALSAMFAPDVVMPAPRGQFARGAAAATEALRGNPDNLTSRVTWAPIRGGISADGQHGFTFGYMTITKPDGSTTPAKYLGYWVKRPEGWRLAVYKRARAEKAPASPAVMPPSLPSAIVAESKDAATLKVHADSLDAIERAFSNEAQKIGIGPAFAKYGSSDAVNMGPPTEPQFTVGSEAIGRSVGAGYPPDSPGVSWAPESVIVATSGDLGITIGFIRPNAPSKDPKAPSAFPFFTIWHRAGPGAEWRYIAE
jgi:ketosteroid isomerase-like protein